MFSENVSLHVLYDKSGGAQKNWQLLKHFEFPVITIITSTYNAAKFLPWTIRSIRKQTYPYIQWIIADGDSKDGTIDLLKQNEDCIDFWFSEKDKGVYDAWNKAVRYIQGDWVIFLGAGDELASDKALDQIAPYLSKAFPEHELVFGNAIYISQENRTVIEKKERSWSEMKGKWVFFRPELPGHATIFQHKSMFTGLHTFNTKYRITGDIEFLLKSLRKKEPYYCPVDISIILYGGLSYSVENLFCMYTEICSMNKDLGIKLPFKHWLVTMVKLILKLLVYKLFPKNTAFKVLDMCRMVQGLQKKWSIK
jgi:glycosyltransferase involved in cell wall biosynthesis